MSNFQTHQDGLESLAAFLRERFAECTAVVEPCRLRPGSVWIRVQAPRALNLPIIDAIGEWESEHRWFTMRRDILWHPI